MEFDDEGVRDLLHDVALNLGVLHLVGPDDEVFLEGLDRVRFPSVLFPCEINFAERASTHHFEQ